MAQAADRVDGVGCNRLMVYDTGHGAPTNQSFLFDPVSGIPCVPQHAHDIRENNHYAPPFSDIYGRLSARFPA